MNCAVLLVAPDHAQRQPLASFLSRLGLNVMERPALPATRRVPNVDAVVVVSAGLPARTVWRFVTRAGASLPILVMADLAPAERACFLLGGASDVLPVATPAREVAARIRAKVRRSRRSAAPHAVTRTPRQLTLDGRRVPLTPTEAQVLQALLETPGRTVTYTKLELLLWGHSSVVQRRRLRVNVSNLRKKLRAAGMNVRVEAHARTGFVLHAPSYGPQLQAV